MLSDCSKPHCDSQASIPAHSRSTTIAGSMAEAPSPFASTGPLVRNPREATWNASSSTGRERESYVISRFSHSMIATAQATSRKVGLSCFTSAPMKSSGTSDQCVGMDSQPGLPVVPSTRVTLRSTIFLNLNKLPIDICRTAHLSFPSKSNRAFTQFGEDHECSCII